MNPWLAAFLASAALFQLVAIPALILRKNDLADVLWGPAFPLAAFCAAYCRGLSELGPRQFLVLGLVAAWAARLFAHVGRRNLGHLDREDVRYANWRKQWGATWLWRSWLQVFVLQAVILYVFLLSVLSTITSPHGRVGTLTVLGLALWVAGFVCEAVADEQLRRFKRAPAHRGKLISTGLWSWSRHPNYFGEILLWWGIWVIAMEDASAWWTVVAPLGVTYLLRKVSGVTMLEELMRSRPGYEEYERSVPRLIPIPPMFRNSSLYRKFYAQ
jgi:steroid 5-alpha reductase family enzyme